MTTGSRNLKRQSGAAVWRDIMKWYERYDAPLRVFIAQLTLSARDDPSTLAADVTRAFGLLIYKLRAAEDVAQEAFMHLYFARSSGPIQDPKRFLFATARNLVKGGCCDEVASSFFQRRRRRREVSSDEN